MKVVNFPKDFKKHKKTMILGSFNSFHNGHKKLLDVAKTFNNKIAIILINDTKMLNREDKKDFHSFDIRLQQLSNIGIDFAVILNLDSKVKNMSGKDFAQKLIELYNVKKFVVGKDFAMGKMAKYKANDLQSDFDTTIVDYVEINGKKLSTSLLHEFVEFGDVDLVKKNSPFYYTISTRVKEDKTFNIKGLSPHRGIYAAWAIVNNVKYWSIIRVSKIRVSKNNEIHIPDLIIKNSGYDVQIEFVKQIRSIIRDDFDKINEEDIEKVLSYLKNHL